MIYVEIDEVEEDRVYAAMWIEYSGANAMLLGFRVVLVNQEYSPSRALSATDPGSRFIMPATETLWHLSKLPHVSLGTWMYGMSLSGSLDENTTK